MTLHEDHLGKTQGYQGEQRLDAESRTPFFIVGAGRSGTTLVRALLDAHSRLAVPPETHYLKFANAFGAESRDAPEDFDVFWDALTATRRFRDLAVEPERVLELSRERGRSFRGILESMLSAYAEANGKPRAGEKTPGHFEFLGQIFGWWPDARVIAVRRDPRAVIASQLGSPWVTRQLEARGRNSPVLPRLRLYHVAYFARRWNEIYTSHLRACPEGQLHLVQYENLVADPESETRKMAAFLMEEFEIGMLNDRTKTQGAAAREEIASAEWRDWLQRHEDRSRRAISSDALEKWRTSLNPREIAVIEAMCGDTMRRFGYTPEAHRPRRLYPSLLGSAALRTFGAEQRARSGVRRVRQVSPGCGPPDH